MPPTGVPATAALFAAAAKGPNDQEAIAAIAQEEVGASTMITKEIVSEAMMNRGTLHSYI